MPGMSRRTFLWLTGGSGVALATDPSRKLINKLIPQIIPPENIQPGEWVSFATTCRECPAGCGMHVRHRDGRATKAEGNPLHPVNVGRLCPRGQSALQGLFDPDRVKNVVSQTSQGQKVQDSWNNALEAISARLKSGNRAVIISSLQTGSLAEVMQQFAERFGAGRTLMYEAFNGEALKTANETLFGLPLVPSCNIAKSELLLSFGADFLETWISPVSFAGQFAEMHSFHGKPSGSTVERSRPMNRFVYVGPRLSMTAANADEFVQVPPGAERLVALALVKIIVDQGWGSNDLAPVMPDINRFLAESGPVPGVAPKRLQQLAGQFTQTRNSVALAGPMGANNRIAMETAAAVALLNHVAGRMGEGVDFSRPQALSAAAREADLQGVMASIGPRDIIFVHDTNPLYSRPDLAPYFRKAGMIISMGTLMDETAIIADWVLPVDTPLESWGDYEPVAGVHGIMQPTMGRLYDTRSAGDLFLELSRRAGKPLSGSDGKPAEDFFGWLRQRWERLADESAPSIPREQFWIDVLRTGGFWNAGAKSSETVRLKPSGLSFTAFPQPTVQKPAADTAELWLWASIMLYDGRLANRGWLQEAPDPLTFFVWGNWIDIHPRKAAGLRLKDGDLAELSTSAGTIRASVRITNEVQEQTVALAYGQGHTELGTNAKGIGTNAFMLGAGRENSSMFGVCRIRRVERSDENGPRSTAHGREQHERGIVQWAPYSEVSGMAPGDGDELILPLPEGYRPGRDMYPKREYLKHRWAMVIDLQRCIGCGACTVACYAENNIAVIGREDVGGGREMAWLRVPPYRKPGSAMRYGWVPMLCQHCDAAPCEPVCPVYAAMHNEEGLNAQIYNRCIGTRYCSNNCPYKVRRFNWINVEWRKPLDLQLNPEVTVRTRGVMEKCTFCIQRIRQAEYRAARERRRVRDGEIQPACLQTCPTKVFTFGDLLDPDAEVTRLTRNDPRRYHVLEGLNTKPAITYLRRVDADG